MCDMHWKVLREQFHLVVPKPGATGLEVQPHRPLSEQLLP